MAEREKFEIIIGDFSGGLNTLDSEYEVADNDSTVLENFEVFGKGSIRKRYGFDIISTGGSTTAGVRGLIRFKKLAASSTDQLCIFNNGHLYTVTPASFTWTDAGAYGTETATRTNGLVYDNMLIFGNGDTANAVKKFDGTTLSSLGGSPGKFSLFEKHRGFIFGSGILTERSVVYWSDVDDPEDWTTGLAASLAVSLDDGDEVMGMFSHNESFIVFKKNSKYILQPLEDTDNIAVDWQQSEIVDRSDGTLSGNSVAKTWNGFYFLGTQGFQAYGVDESYPDRRRPKTISPKIDTLVKNINKYYANQSTGIFYDNRYRCSVPMLNSSTNDTEYVYYPEFQSWAINTGLRISDYAIFENSSGDEAVYFGWESAGKLCKFNKRYSDNYSSTTSSGTPINARWRSKTFYKGNSKMAFDNIFSRVVIRGKMTSNCTAKVILTVDKKREEFTIDRTDIIDGAETGGYLGSAYSAYVDTVATASGEPAMLPFLSVIDFPQSINNGREINVGIVCDTGGSGIEINWIAIQGEKMSEDIIKHTVGDDSPHAVLTDESGNVIVTELGEPFLTK